MVLDLAMIFFLYKTQTAKEKLGKFGIHQNLKLWFIKRHYQ